MTKARLFNQNHPKHHLYLSQILLKGGLIGAVWGHHLYFLACNAYDNKAVSRLNRIKNRPETQVLASPGSSDEAEEFSDLNQNKALVKIATTLNLTPKQYIKFLFNKFPLAIELLSNNKAPDSITQKHPQGKTIWIIGYEKDKFYNKFLESVRIKRKNGIKVVFAGSSLNITGNNTMTIKQTEEVIRVFGPHLDAISIHPRYKEIRKIQFSSSSSAVSFINDRPKLLRLGTTPIKTLQKYIPNLEIPRNFAKTRKHT